MRNKNKDHISIAVVISLLFLVLLIFASCEEVENEDVPIGIIEKEECTRLENGDYDNYPIDRCVCVYLIDGDTGIGSSYTFSHQITTLNLRMHKDSLICGYDVIDYGLYSVVSGYLGLEDGTLLECDC